MTLRRSDRINQFHWILAVKIRNDLQDDFFDLPFDENSEIDRAYLAKSLDGLYENIVQPSVAILDGRWGVGKTTFIKRWIRGSDDKKFSVLYFDAFAHDYMDQPFDALSASLLGILSSKIDKTDSRYQKIKSSAVDVSKRLAVSGAKLAIRFGTAGLIDGAMIDSIATDISAEAGDLAEKAVEAVLERQAQDKAAFDLFRSNLGKISDLLCSDDTDDQGQKNVIFVIDELDRCRPDFALGILECLKHFFRADKLHFLLVTNKDVIRKSVEARYGIGDSSEEYLQKFYDFTIGFERSAEYEHNHVSANYSKKIISNLLKGKVDGSRIHSIQSNTAQICRAFNLTLRDAEHIATSLCLAFLSLSDRQFSPSPWLVFLSFFKVKHPSVYTAIKNGSPCYSSVEAVLDSGVWADSYDIGRIKTAFRYFLSETVDANSEEFFGLSSGTHFLDRREQMPYLANNVLDFFGR